jgi:hypothetical protein
MILNAVAPHIFKQMKIGCEKYYVAMNFGDINWKINLISNNNGQFIVLRVAKYELDV